VYSLVFEGGTAELNLTGFVEREYVFERFQSSWPQTEMLVTPIKHILLTISS